tara:strand:- start:1211 stop:1432 length:222 start_codon:yes stop_codon:yes gene_type:complete
MSDEYPRADWKYCRSCHFVHLDVSDHCPKCNALTSAGSAFISHELAMVGALRAQLSSQDMPLLFSGEHSDETE